MMSRLHFTLFKALAVLAIRLVGSALRAGESVRA